MILLSYNVSVKVDPLPKWTYVLTNRCLVPVIIRHPGASSERINFGNTVVWTFRGAFSDGWNIYYTKDLSCLDSRMMCGTFRTSVLPQQQYQPPQ